MTWLFDILIDDDCNIQDFGDGFGDDVIASGDGDDSNLGDVRTGEGSGNDTIASGKGDEQSNGNGGNDNIVGGEADDTLTGGPGADVFSCGKGEDMITDYNPDEGDIKVHDCENF